MILSCRNVGKSFGAEEILTGVSFHIEENEKVAVVGDNGAGKTTLLRLLTGELTPDAGEVTVSGGATIGILKQNADEDSHRSVHEEVLYANLRCGIEIDLAGDTSEAPEILILKVRTITPAHDLHGDKVLAWLQIFCDIKLCCYL